MKNKVVIVGGGMVGAAAAVKLAMQGADVTVLEHQIITPEGVLGSDKIDIRISAINRFSEALLDELGAMSILRQSRVAPYHQLEVYEKPSNRLSFDCTELGESHLGHLIENSLVQASLWCQFEQWHIRVEKVSSQPTEIEYGTDDVVLHYGEKSYRADLLIAADGGRSAVRELANIGTTGWQYQQSCMGILIKLEAEQQIKTWQQFKPSGPIAFLPMQAPYANLIWYQDSNTLATMAKMSNAQLESRIREYFFELPGDFSVCERAVFPLTRQHANSYSNGRVVLIGDAAHTINPLAGQGVNLGFKDVAALADCLKGHTDLGAFTLLKEYERARRRDNLTMMSMMDACYFGFSNTLSPLKLLRNSALKLANNAGPLKTQVLKYALGGAFR
jgi:2-octaprenyl-3-methyl-6-methoxy-1,4-benzoquinol hydroxylase